MKSATKSGGGTGLASIAIAVAARLLLLSGKLIDVLAASNR